MNKKASPPCVSLGAEVQLATAPSSGEEYIVRDSFLAARVIFGTVPLLIHLPHYDNYSSLFLEGDTESLHSAALSSPSMSPTSPVRPIGNMVPIITPLSGPPRPTTLVLYPNRQLGRPARILTVYMAAEMLSHPTDRPFVPILRPPASAPKLLTSMVVTCLANQLDLSLFPLEIYSIVIFSAAPVRLAKLTVDMLPIRYLTSDKAMRHAFGIPLTAKGFHMPFDSGVYLYRSHLVPSRLPGLELTWDTEEGAPGGTIVITGKR